MVVWILLFLSYEDKEHACYAQLRIKIKPYCFGITFAMAKVRVLERCAFDVTFQANGAYFCHSLRDNVTTSPTGFAGSVVDELDQCVSNWKLWARLFSA